ASLSDDARFQSTFADEAIRNRRCRAKTSRSIRHPRETAPRLTRNRQAGAVVPRAREAISFARRASGVLRRVDRSRADGFVRRPSVAWAVSREPRAGATGDEELGRTPVFRLPA